MSIILEPSHNTKYNVAGINVINNYVDTISLTKTVLGSITEPFKGNHTAIQETIDKFIEKGTEEFKKKVSKTYPSANKVIDFTTSIMKLGGDSTRAILMLTASGECLLPSEQSLRQQGGGKRKKRTKTKKRKIVRTVK